MRYLGVLLCALFFSSARAQAVPHIPGRGTLTGHVICNDTHTPCRFASVTIEALLPAAPNDLGAGLAQPSRAAATDINGAYTLGNVVPGEYLIVGRAPGYLAAADLIQGLQITRQADPQARTALQEAGLESVDVPADGVVNKDLLLNRGAVLSGTVRYDDGGLAPNLSIVLYRKDPQHVWKRFTVQSASGVLGLLGMYHTDEAGHFQIFGLPPGTYTVEAKLPSIVPLPAGIVKQQDLGLAITEGQSLSIFYGNKFRLKAAAALEVKDAETHPAVDIEVPTSGLHTLSGSLARGDSTSGPVATLIRLEDPDDGLVLRETDSHEDGSFTFTNVPNGSYRLYIPAGGTKSGSTSLQTLSTTLEIQSDRSDLNFVLQPAATGKTP